MPVQRPTARPDLLGQLAKVRPHRRLCHWDATGSFWLKASEQVKEALAGSHS